MREHDHACRVRRAIASRYPEEVRDFAEFLLNKRAQKKHEAPAFDWEGDLKDLADQYTSVELQHEILRMRGD